jgi:hypothetical protein
MKILVLWLSTHSAIYVHGLAFRPTTGQMRRWTGLEPGKPGSGWVWNRVGPHLKAIPPRLPWAVPTADTWGLMVPLAPPCVGCGKVPGNDGLRPKFKPGGLNSR